MSDVPGAFAMALPHSPGLSSSSNGSVSHYIDPSFLYTPHAASEDEHDLLTACGLDESLSVDNGSIE